MNDIVYIISVLAGCIVLVIIVARFIEKRSKSFPKLIGEEYFVIPQSKSNRIGSRGMVVLLLLFLGITSAAVYYNNETLILLCIIVVALVYVLSHLIHAYPLVKLIFEKIKERRSSEDGPGVG